MSRISERVEDEEMESSVKSPSRISTHGKEVEISANSDNTTEKSRLVLLMWKISAFEFL